MQHARVLETDDVNAQIAFTGPGDDVNAINHTPVSAACPSQQVVYTTSMQQHSAGTQKQQMSRAALERAAAALDEVGYSLEEKKRLAYAGIFSRSQLLQLERRVKQSAFVTGYDPQENGRAIPTFW